jgi:molybdate transport system substrate-binding protein
MIGKNAGYARTGLLLIILCSVLAPASAPLEELPASKATVQLTIAAPAELSSAITRLARAFEQKSKKPVHVEIAALADFHSTLRRPANFDAVFSIDSRALQRLAASGMIVPSSGDEVASDQLALCVSPLVGVEFPARNPLLGLKEKAISSIAIPDPRTVYGRAAKQALNSIKVYSPVIAEKLAVGNLSAVAELMERGDSSVALLPQSALQTYSLRGTRVIPVPRNLYPPIRMRAALARQSSHKRQAIEFLRFVVSDDGKVILRQSGFSEPQRGFPQKH